MGKFRAWVSFAAALFFVPLLPVSGWCEGYRVIRVADSLSNPELGFFNAAAATPVLEGDYVVFRTLNSVSVVANIWSWNRRTNQFLKLVGLDTPAPGGVGNFTDLNAGLGGPILKDGIVVFGARDSGAPGSPALPVGIFSVPVTGGAVQRIASYQTSVPGGIGSFFQFGGISGPTGNLTFSDGVVGFRGEFGGGPVGNSGVYQSDISGGSMLPVADSLHEIGTLFPVKNFTHIQTHSNRAAFIGGNVFGYRAIYSTQLPAVLPSYNEVITVDQVLPGASGPFSFALPSLRLFNDSIFFIAIDSDGVQPNNRRTLYEIPFAGGAPSKIVSNFDSLEGLSSIEYSSISSYDVNSRHILIRAKAPGSTPQQGLYLFDRVSRTVSRMFSLDQSILGRSFGVLSEVQPGAFSSDSSSAVVSLGGSALFVGPYTYIVLITNEPEVTPTPTPGDGSVTVQATDLLDRLSRSLPQARRVLPQKPSRNLTKKKRDEINRRIRAIQSARRAIRSDVSSLRALEGSFGGIVRGTYPNVTAANLRKLGSFAKSGSSADRLKAGRAWRSFASLLKTIRKRYR